MDAKKEIGQKLGIRSYQEPIYRVQYLLKNISYKNAHFNIYHSEHTNMIEINIQMLVADKDNEKFELPATYTKGSYLFHKILIDPFVIRQMKNFEKHILDLIWQGIQDMEMEYAQHWFKVAGKPYKP